MGMRRRYYRELQNNDMIHTEKCSPEEVRKYKAMKVSEIPDDIDTANTENANEYIKYTKDELSDEELKIFTLAKINSNLKIIKSGVVSFVVLAIIGVILGIIGLVQ